MDLCQSTRRKGIVIYHLKIEPANLEFRENFAMYVDLLQNWRVTPESHQMDSLSDENFQSFSDRIIMGFG